MSRVKLVGGSVDEQLADLIREIEELKTPQFISQNSGMIGRNAAALLRDDFGDIVTLEGNFSVPGPTSHIPCPATPDTFYYNTIYCYQRFVPEHGKPTVCIPMLQLYVRQNGVEDATRFEMRGYRFAYYTEIHDRTGQVVGDMNIMQDLGAYMQPLYTEDGTYYWVTQISYSSRVPFELSCNFTVRATDSGYTESRLEGLFF